MPPLSRIITWSATGKNCAVSNPQVSLVHVRSLLKLNDGRLARVCDEYHGCITLSEQPRRPKQVSENCHLRLSIQSTEDVVQQRNITSRKYRARQGLGLTISVSTSQILLGKWYSPPVVSAHRTS
jgi:hypothetical protein